VVVYTLIYKKGKIMENLRKPPPLIHGKNLAYKIFETWENLGAAVGVSKTTCRAWRNDNVPSKYRAALVIAARGKGWDVVETDFRGDL